MKLKMRLEPHKISVFEVKLFSKASAKFSSESVIPGVPPKEKWIRGTPGILLLLEEKSMNLKNSGVPPEFRGFTVFYRLYGHFQGIQNISLTLMLASMKKIIIIR